MKYTLNDGITFWDASEFTKEVVDAINNTSFGYLYATAEKHSSYSDKAQGSVIDAEPMDIIGMLTNQEWIKAYHPNVSDPCQLYVPNPLHEVNPIKGRLGVLPIGVTMHMMQVDSMGQRYGGNELWFTDPKETGHYTPTVAASQLAVVESELDIPDPTENFTVCMIIGPKEDGPGKQVYTFHPGAPIKPSKLTREDAEVLLRQEGLVLSVAEGGKWSQRPRFEDYKFNYTNAMNMGLTSVLINHGL